MQAYRNPYLSTFIRYCGSVGTCWTILRQYYIRKHLRQKILLVSHVTALVADWTRQGLGQMPTKSTSLMCPKTTAHASCGDRRRGSSLRRCKWISREIMHILDQFCSSTRERLPELILRDHSRLRPKDPRRPTVDVMQETIWRNVDCEEGVCSRSWRPAAQCVKMCRRIDPQLFC